MADVAVWKNLPAEEHDSVWEETERNFWDDFERNQHMRRSKADNHYQSESTQLKVEIGMLAGKRNELTKTQERLSRELAAIDGELALVRDSCETKSSQLNELEREYRKGQTDMIETRQSVTVSMTNFFRKKRGLSPLRDADIDYSAPRSMVPQGRAGNAHKSAQVDVLEELRQINALPKPAAKPSGNPANALANVVDADGAVIGPVERIDAWNQWVESIQSMPVRRNVAIRRGRRFNQDHLFSIYERTEPKGVKWLACMIQATGEVQSTRCQSCEKNQGAFDQCIIVGGELFPKCGNCEWNRQGCHGASKEANSVDPASVAQEKRHHHALRHSLRFGREAEMRHAAEEAHQAALSRAPMRHGERHGERESHLRAMAKAAGIREELMATEPRTTTEQVLYPSLNRGRTVLPSTRESHQLPTPQESPEYIVSNSFTPANSRPKPMHTLPPLPTVRPSDSLLQHIRPTKVDPVGEITRDKLVLRHDGRMYTYPECMAGVPLDKVDNNHWYWEQSWPDVKSIIVPQWESWKIKYARAVESQKDGKTGGSSKYQIGRQVNRGAKILEFLDQGDISPYQLLGKSYIWWGKGGITSYDTLFRLSETLSELAKFKLDVSPTEWMRQRLWEIMETDGSCFNLSRTVHDFYHDSKLAALRAKHGFKNIGRPSGANVKSNRDREGSETPDAGSRKRKDTHSPTRENSVGTPTNGPSPRTGDASMPPESPSVNSIPNKRLRLDGTPPTGPASVASEIEIRSDDFSDTDSFSGAPISENDFRLYQIKTRVYTSAPNVTQYWVWWSDTKIIEHQVLRESHPVIWNELKAPIEFGVNPKEMAMVAWNREALRVHVVVKRSVNGDGDVVVMSKKDGKPRGDIMASFKRERTLKRFVKLCQKLELKTVEVTEAEIMSRWNGMKSEELSTSDDEASSDLKE